MLRINTPSHHGRPLKRLLDTWDWNGSTSGPTPWKIYGDGDDDDDDDDDRDFELLLICSQLQHNALWNLDLTHTKPLWFHIYFWKVIYYSRLTWQRFVFFSVCEDRCWDLRLWDNLKPCFQLLRLCSFVCYRNVTVEGKWVRIWEEARMLYFKVLWRHSPEEAEEYHKT